MATLDVIVQYHLVLEKAQGLEAAADLMTVRPKRSIYESMRASYSQIELMRDKPGCESLPMSKALSARKHLEGDYPGLLASHSSNKASLINLKALVSSNNFLWGFNVEEHE